MLRNLTILQPRSNCLAVGWFLQNQDPFNRPFCDEYTGAAAGMAAEQVRSGSGHDDLSIPRTSSSGESPRLPAAHKQLIAGAGMIG